MKIGIAILALALMFPTGGLGEPASTKPSTSAQTKLDKLAAKYGNRLLYNVDDELKIIFATDLDRDTLAETKSLMTAHARALQRDLFQHGLTDYLPVIIPKSWANPKVTGHFYGDRVDARTIGSNLKHEFTHALHWADQQGLGQEHPVWIMEGMASLFENSKVIDGHIIPQTGLRVAELQDQVRRKATAPFKRMLALEHRQFTSQHYAQARFMLLYLFSKQQLAPWYKAYTANFAQDRTGQDTLEKICGKPLDAIEKDWTAWVMGLPVPGPLKCSIGVRFKQLPDSLAIEETMPDGPAAGAKLAAGDAILSLDNQRIIDPEDLVTALLPHEPGQSVELQFRRDGQVQTTALKLGTAPTP